MRVSEQQPVTAKNKKFFPDTFNQEEDFLRPGNPKHFLLLFMAYK